MYSGWIYAYVLYLWLEEGSPMLLHKQWKYLWALMSKSICMHVWQYVRYSGHRNSNPRHFIPAFSCHRWDMGVGRQNNLLRMTKPWSQLRMPRFIVYAGHFSYYYAVLEYFIIEFQIKALVEMIHHLTEQNFLLFFFFLTVL